MLVLFLVLILLLVVTVFQINSYKDRILFQPRKIMNPTFEGVKDLFLERDWNGTVKYSSEGINVWHYHSNENDKTVLFCHGSNGNISQRKYIYDFCKIFKLNLILFDYYGYGKSSGKPSQSNIYKSADIIWEYAIKQCSSLHQMIIWGESLGGTVAGYLGNKYGCFKLILMSTFSSLDDILYHSKNQSLPNKFIMFSLKKFCITFPTKYFMKDIKCPVLIVHSIDDEIIPIPNAEILYCSIPHQHKQMITIKGTHTSPIFTTEQLIKFLDFCNIDYSKVPDKTFEQIIFMMTNVIKKDFD